MIHPHVAAEEVEIQQHLEESRHVPSVKLRSVGSDSHLLPGASPANTPSEPVTPKNLVKLRNVNSDGTRFYYQSYYYFIDLSTYPCRQHGFSL